MEDIKMTAEEFRKVLIHMLSRIDDVDELEEIYDVIVMYAQ